MVTSSRGQWKLITAIAARPQGCTVGALARDLNCTPRTIYRDLDAIQQAGFPLYSSRVDGRARWQFVDGFRVSFAIPFTLPELLALHFTQDLLKVLRGTVFHDDLAGALSKIRRTLPESSLAFLERVAQAFGAGRGPMHDYSRYRGLLGQLNMAIPPSSRSASGTRARR
ncbi:MAG: HTH domain-containing protein [Deltaproteobacteria bacterium]|nr:HTH domain-containing protein [Deltaproteobacteria bacterium]